MSSVSNIRIRAEDYAYAEIDSLRTIVLGLIGGSDSVSGWQGSNLRNSIQAAITSGIAKITAGSKSYLDEAWSAGVSRASAEFNKQIPNLPGTSIPSGVDEGMEIVRAANEHTSAGLAKSLRVLLSRASLSDEASIDSVLSNLRDRSSSGFFDSAKQQIAGTLSEEVTVLEGRAHSLRSKEIEAFLALQKRTGALTKTKTLASGATKKLIPVTIRVWRHGSSAVPRPHHLSMDHRGVVFDHAHTDIPFHVMAKDGTVYYAMAPKQAPLPMSEQWNCSCYIVNKVVWVTEEQKQALIARSIDSGGFHDSRW